MKKYFTKIKNWIINKQQEDPDLFFLWCCVIILIILCAIVFTPMALTFCFVGETYTYKVKPDGSLSSDDSGDGGGSGGNDSSQADKERSMADKLEDVANRNHDLLDAKLNNGMDVYNISDQQSRELWAQQTKDNKQKAANDWFRQTKKLQGSANQLRSQAGDSFNGSNFYAFLDLLGQADDDIDNETLMTKKANQDTINNDLYEALSSSVNGRNELAADSQYAHGQIGTDFLAQVANIAGGGDNPELYDEKTGAGAVSRGNNVYNERKVGPAAYTDQGLYREDNAAARAKNMYSPNISNATAANDNYWNKMFGNYNNR